MQITLDDLRLIRDVKSIARLYHQLGYETDLEPIEFSASEALLEGAAAQSVNSVYILVDLNGLQHVHFESSDLSGLKIRQVSENFLKRPGTHLLSFSQSSYDSVIFVKPSRSEGKIKLSKLKLDPRRPTTHDLSILRAISFENSISSNDIHQKQVKAFDVERVTREFYRVYHDLFVSVREAIVSDNPNVQIGFLRRQTTSDQPALHAFTQRLLSRIMFLYFIQKKGWLNQDHDFLTTLYRERANNNGRNFYLDVLEPLFFQTLNTKRLNNNSDFGSIPYLNGSLFEREYPEATNLTIPNQLFDPRESGSILNIFNSYNFTIEESSSLDQEVSLDPEMLGKVFENMMEAEEAARNGTFYTPRSIVQFLAEETLTRYLEEKTKIGLERLRPLLSEEENFGDINAEEARAIIKHLKEVRVLDPAVGTASMLVGVLNVMMRIRQNAEARLGTHVSPGSPALGSWKREYINDCLYGVDIKQEAIEIGRLRLWLSLVVDATEPEPLPSLDYKLMAGDGLLESIDGTPFLKPNRETELFGYGAEISQLTDEINRLHHNFFVEEEPDKRRSLRQAIQECERQLFKVDIQHRIENYNNEIINIRQRKAKGVTRKSDLSREQNLGEQIVRLMDSRRKVLEDKEPLPYFLHNVHFTEVMNRPEKGFDIVIGNPPYVSIINMQSDYKNALHKAFPEVSSGRADLYVYFFKKGFDLLCERGILAYITPNKYLRAAYGEPLRSFLAYQTSIQILIDFGNLPVFDAVTSPFITLAQKFLPQSQSEFFVITELDLKGHLSSSTDGRTDQTRDGLDIFHQFANRLFFRQSNEILTNESWTMASQQVVDLIRKIENRGQPLKSFFDIEILYGIKSGLNEAFIITKDQKEQFIQIDPSTSEVIKPFLTGRDVRRWSIDFNHRYMIFTNRGFEIDKYPVIKDHLLKFRKKLSERATAQTHPWYELQQPQQGVYELYRKPKIIYPEMARSSAFAFDTNGLYINNKCFCIPTEDKYLVAILNSRLVYFWLMSTCVRLESGSYEYRSNYIEKIPLVEPSLEQKIELQNHCDDSNFDALNKLVFDIYGPFEKSEIDLINDFTSEML